MTGKCQPNLDGGRPGFDVTEFQCVYEVLVDGHWVHAHAAAAGIERTAPRAVRGNTRSRRAKVTESPENSRRDKLHVTGDRGDDPGDLTPHETKCRSVSVRSDHGQGL